MLDICNDDIIAGVVEEFMAIADIPRPSGHEKAVSDYLKTAFEEAGCTVVQDEANNIIADFPATAGFENAYLTVLQAHMDMVCVAEPGKKYNPLTDPIELMTDESGCYLMANGTSLGADDGIGIAEILFVLKNIQQNGPIRVIITTDEEQGMTGAKALDAKYLLDATYLINCDSENFDEITTGSAGSVLMKFKRSLEYVPCSKTKGRRISINGLLGGHSGTEIHKGRGNAIRTMLFLLKDLFENSIMCDLADIYGGKAVNAIADEAVAVIATDADDEDILRVISQRKDIFKSLYGSAGDSIEIELTEVPVPEKILHPLLKRDLIHLTLMLHSGVLAMSQLKPSMVETSANLGMLRLKDGFAELSYFARSSIDEKLHELAKVAEIQAAVNSFECEVGDFSPGWKERSDSMLMLVLNEIFQNQNGFPMQVETIHAGLECGWHYQKNPELDMVSIGATTVDIHSPKEKLMLESIVPQVKLIIGALENIAMF